MKQEKNIWEQSRVELFQKLDCRETGLSQEDAADRLAKYGANELHAGKQKSVLQIFLGQFADFLVLILILAAVISACMGDVESMIVILAVITMNAILGTVQTVKASASLDSLKQMSAPTAKVLRDGQIVQIPGREVVPGDVVILEAGDSVCADGRLLECASLKCAESALTGESLPVEKDTEPLSGETALGDRKNMVFSGSFVTYGRGRFLVTATGMDTEMGKIAQLLKNTEERKTPLQVSLDQFGRKLSIIILVICAVLFGVSVLWRHENVMNAFLFAVALAVGVELPAGGGAELGGGAGGGCRRGCCCLRWRGDWCWCRRLKWWRCIRILLDSQRGRADGGCRRCSHGRACWWWWRVVRAFFLPLIFKPLFPPFLVRSCCVGGKRLLHRGRAAGAWGVCAICVGGWYRA